MATKKITDLTQLTDLDATDSFVINDSSAGADKRVEFSDLQSEVLNGAAIGTSTAITELQVDNLNLNGNTFSSTDTNGNILIQPNGTGATVINESGAASDFRVEGDTEQNLLFVDASADRVGIGTNAPLDKMHIAGGKLFLADTDPTIAGSIYGYTDTSNPTYPFSAGLKLQTRFWNGSAYVYSDKVTLNAVGNVGIGVTPVYKLDVVQDDNSLTALRVRNNDAGASAYAGLIVNPSGNSWLLRSGSTAANSNSLEFALDSTSPSVKATIDSSGNVGIGVTPANFNGVTLGDSILDVNGVIQVRGDATNGNALLQFGGNTYRKAALYSPVGTDVGYLAVGIAGGGSNSSTSEIARFTPDGLTFNGDTAAANALDDYEEGTWTPVYTASSGAFGAITYSAFGPNVGRYTKIGNVVYITGQIRTDSVTIGTVATALRIGGLPFTSVNETVASYYREGRIVGDANPFGTGWGTVTIRPSRGRVLNGTTTIELLSDDYSGGIFSVVDPTLIGTSFNQNGIVFSGFYFV